MYRALLFTFFTHVIITAQPINFIKGVDVSFIQQLEDNGAVYFNNGRPADPFDIFEQNEINYIRLRIWHTPADGYNGLQKTLLTAQRIKSLGFKLLLDFHYSDTWADPSNQEKPAAWDTLSYNELTDSVIVYTKSVIAALNSVNALPDMVQIGNEIFNGFLWPEGRVGSAEQWEQFTGLLTAASNAVNSALPAISIPVMIHIEKGGYNSDCRTFFDNLAFYNVPFDVIGLSLYPWWHGDLAALSSNINDLAVRFNKDIIVVETAYPWTLDSLNDGTANFVTNENQTLPGYPASLTGQYLFLYDLIQIIKAVPNNRGKGLCYWAPEYISLPSLGSSWENLTLFDFQGNALKSTRVFKEPGPPAVDSVWSYLLTKTSVNLYADINSGNKMSSITFQWDIDSNAVWQNNSAAVNSPLMIGTASCSITGLIPGTTYYYRSYVSNALGSDTSVTRSFTTSLTVSLSIYLQGPYTSSGIMSTALNSGGYIPLSQPYNISPWNYNGTESVETVPPGIVDWVLLELRSGTAASTVAGKRAAFLKSNGTIVDLNGISPVSFNGVSFGNYYLVVRHRNHIPVMCSAAITTLNGNLKYDFTTGSDKFFGGNAGAAQISSTPAVWGMFAGDANGDGTVKFSGANNDRTVILNKVGLSDITTVVPDYNSADLNLDGVTKFSGSNNDRTIILNIVGLSDITNIISSQVQ